MGRRGFSHLITSFFIVAKRINLPDLIFQKVIILILHDSSLCFVFTFVITNLFRERK